MTTLRKIQAYDLAESFGEGAKGRQEFSVIDNEGKMILTRSAWTAGVLAYGALRVSTVAADGSPGLAEPAELTDAIPSLVADADSRLSADFLPKFVADLDAGLVAIQPTPMNGAQFLKAWSDFDTIERIGLFLQVADSARAALAETPDFVPHIKAMAALGILVRIDDAAIAAWLDDVQGAMLCSADIERFRAHLEEPDRTLATIDVAVRMALANRASAGGKAKYETHNRAREFVAQEWATHRSAYGGNKSEFARHYVRRVFNEFGVSITEKTVREVWLADTPTAS